MIPIQLDSGCVYWSPEPLADPGNLRRLVAVEEDAKLPCGDRANRFFGYCTVAGECQHADECPVA